MKNSNKTKGIFILSVGLILMPFFALAVNDVQVSDNTNFELNTFDTAVLTTLVASSGGQVTNFDVQSNYIDITLDNLSTVTFTTTVGGQYLKIIKQSGSNAYTVNPSCPTNTVTLTGTGATVVLRLEVLTTNSCTPGPTIAITAPTKTSTGTITNTTVHITDSNGVLAANVNAASSTVAFNNFNCTQTNANTVDCTVNITSSGNFTVSATDNLSNSSSASETGYTISSGGGGGGGGGGGATTNGTCGSANGASYSSASLIPVLSLCSAGNYSMISGSGPWTWTCLGLNGGTSSPVCTANKATNFPIGCNSTSGYSLTTGLSCSGTIPISAPTTLSCTPTPTVCSPYMTKYIQLGATNDPAEVVKLQNFLIKYEGFSNLSATGIYDQATYNAVKAFQLKYAQEILTPWGFVNPTGIVQRTTVAEINKIYCQVIAAATSSNCTPAPTVCAPYMTKYIQLGAVNDPAEVEKLEEFLEKYEGAVNLNENGIYDQAMFNAVKTFQTKYSQDILAPWGFVNPTGIVQRTTVAEINKLYCAANSTVAATPTSTTSDNAALIAELIAKIASLKAQIQEIEEAATTQTTATTTTGTPSPACSPYMTKYISLGAVNDPAEVIKLQDFLIRYEGFTNLTESGIYDLATYNAVKAFQIKYAQDILTPWGFVNPTGIVQRTTVKEINKIYCAAQTKS